MVFVFVAVCLPVVLASTTNPAALVSWPSGSVFAEPGMDSWDHLVDAADGPPQLVLRQPTSRFGCDVDATLPVSPPFALLVERGECSFDDKAKAAVAAGASAVIVTNSLEGMYHAASTGSVGLPLNTTKCDYDCTKGAGEVPAADVTTAAAYAGYQCGGDACGSNRCLLTGVVDGDTAAHQVCCAADDFMDMGGTATIPAVFVTLASADALRDAMVATPNLTVSVALRHLPTIDPSSMIIWAMGVFAVWVASVRSAAAEREAAKRGGAQAVPTDDGASPQPPPEVETMSVTVKGALSFLLMATLVLLGLFFLIKLGVAVVYIVIAMFSFGATSGFAHIVVRPVLLAAFPKLKNSSITVPLCGLMPTHVAYSGVISAGFVVWWLIARHASYAFVLQDVFGICLCCMFLLQVRLPNIKVAVVLLVAFFLYDIFMVFVSPVFFGSSVMVNVATAGLPTAVVNEACYCRLYPDDSKHCGPGEAMPILFRFPRLLDYRGGNAMLGLGDVVLPGLLLSFAARHDYNTRGGLAARGYFAMQVVAYAVGLAMANAAVILMQQGQPALLYIVPAILVPFLILAHVRGELRALWKGTEGDSLSPVTSSAAVPLTADTDDGVDVEMVDKEHHH